MEKQVKIASKLYHCRDTAKSFFGDEFAEKIKPYTHLLTQVMAVNKLDEVQALLKISETNTYQDSGMAQMMFLAATVELIEPSKEISQKLR